MDGDHILVNVYGDKPLLFKSKDVERLRCQHRIVGALVGTLPAFPMQTTFSGLPLLLLPEEFTLLLAKEAVSLAEGSRWQYPTTERERACCLVFEYLWSRQLYITNGSKFGGEFLAYPGDPMRFHSLYVVGVRLKHQTMKPLDIIALGRLATHAKKTFVLAAPKEDDTNNAEVFSLTWAGF